jgi:glycosyltransferase involved in cell wall biosynthesis
VSEPSLLLLIPAYNEELRIEPVLREYASYFQNNYKGKFQLVVILNGCRDNTLGVVRRVEKDLLCISHLDFPDAIGKGGALIEGLRLAPLADVIGYTDADGASTPEALHKIVKMLNRADCVIGSRWLPDSVLHQSQTWVRRFTSRCFHLVVETFFWMHIKDTQCPCKAMRRTAVEKIHSNLSVADLAFDVNLIVAMKKGGFKVLEVPTEWTDKVGSKVTSSLFRNSLTMFLSVVRLRFIYSPFYRFLRPLRPIEAWVYKKLKQPVPRSGRPQEPQAPPPKEEKKNSQ